jgi:hypothetical protein
LSSNHIGQSEPNATEQSIDDQALLILPILKNFVYPLILSHGMASGKTFRKARPFYL